MGTLQDLRIGLTAYGVLSRGLLSDHWSTDRKMRSDDFRVVSSRFRGANLEHNLALVELGACPGTGVALSVRDRAAGADDIIARHDQVRQSPGRGRAQRRSPNGSVRWPA
jgi:hypothetical protein